jgi:hypothetical protein
VGGVSPGCNTTNGVEFNASSTARFANANGWPWKLAEPGISIYAAASIAAAGVPPIGVLAEAPLLAVAGADPTGGWLPVTAVAMSGAVAAQPTKLLTTISALAKVMDVLDFNGVNLS